MHPLRQMRRHLRDDRGLDRADVGDDGAGLERTGDRLGDRAGRADRDAEDDAIGVAHRFGRIGVVAVAEAELLGPLQRRRAARRDGDVADEPAAPRGQRDRRADEPDADQREARKDRRRSSRRLLRREEVGERRDGRLRWPLPCRWSCAARSAGRRPPSRRSTTPRLSRNASASGGASARRRREMDQHEVADARRHLQAERRQRRASPSAATIRCARRPSRRGRGRRAPRRRPRSPAPTR